MPNIRNPKINKYSLPKINFLYFNKLRVSFNVSGQITLSAVLPLTSNHLKRYNVSNHIGQLNMKTRGAPVTGAEIEARASDPYHLIWLIPAEESVCDDYL